MHDLVTPRIDLHQRTTPGAQVRQTGEGGWRLSIPPGSAGKYRLAQLDDYKGSPRSAFTWQPPLAFDLRARVSRSDLQGTWGFGFWNDPFAVSIGLRGAARRLPALPNAAWFFHASPPNYLALRDDHPAVGFLAATFSAPNVPALLFAPALPFLSLLVWPAVARRLRRLARGLVQESADSLDVDTTAWHNYRLELRPDTVSFLVDGALKFESSITPRGPLGLVIWIDNQFAAFPPDGRLRFGTLDTPLDDWVEIADIHIDPLG